MGAELIEIEPADESQDGEEADVEGEVEIWR